MPCLSALTGFTRFIFCDLLATSALFGSPKNVSRKRPIGLGGFVLRRLLHIENH